MVTALRGLSPHCLLPLCAYTKPYMEHIEVQDNIAVVVEYINSVKTRCTFDAAASALGITPQAFKKELGEARPEVSWFVSPTSGEPMRYSDEEKHPELYRTTRIITSASVLKRNLDL